MITQTLPEMNTGIKTGTVKEAVKRTGIRLGAAGTGTACTGSGKYLGTGCISSEATKYSGIGSL